MYPKSFERLIECFQLLPGVGAKTAERYAFTMLDAPQEQIELFAQALIGCKKDIKRCRICGNISDQEECPICQDENRNPRMICVVQSPKDVIAMEKMQEYAGTYHVLNGLPPMQRLKGKQRHCIWISCCQAKVFSSRALHTACRWADIWIMPMN